MQLFVLGGLLAVVALLLACGGGSSSPAAANNPPAQTSANGTWVAATTTSAGQQSIGFTSTITQNGSMQMMGSSAMMTGSGITFTTVQNCFSAGNVTMTGTMTMQAGGQMSMQMVMSGLPQGVTSSQQNQLTMQGTMNSTFTQMTGTYTLTGVTAGCTSQTGTFTMTRTQ
jgi:hypothetical protein